MQLISASRRTDIPAFYARWFLRRLRAGFCEWVNPFGGQVHRVSLRPEDCLGYVCWTRHAGPMLADLPALAAEGRRFAFHYTINGYPRSIESHNPAPAVALRTFRALSNILGPARTWWRYDPILVSPETPHGWHVRNFAAIARELAGFTDRCTFSFPTLYAKTVRNLVRIGIPPSKTPPGEKTALVAELAGIAAGHGIALHSCCDDSLLAGAIGKARCVDGAAFGGWARPAPTRKDCGCVRSVDIGAYDTCLFGCSYCYATNSRRAALGRHGLHNPPDTLLWRPAARRTTAPE